MRLPPTYSLLRVLPVWSFATAITGWCVWHGVAGQDAQKDWPAFPTHWDFSGCADGWSATNGAAWVWWAIPLFMWALISLIGLGMLFNPSWIKCVNLGTPSMKARILKLAEEEGDDSPRLQNILVGLDLYLFSCPLAAMNFCLYLLGASISSWMPACMEQPGCRAAAAAAAAGVGGRLCCADHLPATSCQGSSMSLWVTVVMLGTTVCPLPLLIWWMNKQLLAPSTTAGLVPPAQHAAKGGKGGKEQLLS